MHSTIDRQIESPIPIPSALVVKNASKIRLASSDSIPSSEILYDYHRTLTVIFLDRTRTSRSRSSMGNIASAAWPYFSGVPGCTPSRW